MFLSSGTPSSLFPPSSNCVLVSYVPCFLPPHPPPLPPPRLHPLPLPAPQLAPLFACPLLRRTSLPPSLPPPPSRLVLFCGVPCFRAHARPPSSSPPVGESSFVTCHVSEFTNALPLPP